MSSSTEGDGPNRDPVTPGVRIDGDIVEALSGGPVSSAMTEMISLAEETLVVSKRRLVTSTVRVSTRTTASNATAEVALDQSVVDVIRVPVGRVVEVAPDVRIEGDTTIVPVVEERLVVAKQLVLVEEVHIRRRIKQELVQEPVILRRQQVVVERFDPEGRPVSDGSTQGGSVFEAG